MFSSGRGPESHDRLSLHHERPPQKNQGYGPGWFPRNTGALKNTGIPCEPGQYITGARPRCRRPGHPRAFPGERAGRVLPGLVQSLHCPGSRGRRGHRQVRDAGSRLGLNRSPVPGFSPRSPHHPGLRLHDPAGQHIVECPAIAESPGPEVDGRRYRPPHLPERFDIAGEPFRHV